MPKRTKPCPVRPTPVQLPLFAEAASLARIRPERNEWRFYRMEVWPDLFGRALLLRQWGRIGTEGRRRLDVPYIPMGQYSQKTAYRRTITDMPIGFPLFYGVRPA